MVFVLLSGGSGKRLWPLSNDARSKQFLKVLRNNQGQMESMLQRVWRQVAEAGLSGSTYIVAGKAQMDIIQSQVGQDARIILEPARRDTFPAIALAGAYLHSVAGISLDEVVCVLPVDPYVEASFFCRLQDLELPLRLAGHPLALLGVQPTHPSEKYGYIVPERSVPEQPASVNDWFRVHFLRKNRTGRIRCGDFGRSVHGPPVLVASTRSCLRRGCIRRS